AMTVLRNNDSMVHGAFAMRKTPEGDLLVLRTNLIADLTNIAEIAKVVSAIAWQADVIEQQLTGANDQH
ncbi:MAG: SPFH domain-containing protein, partial [Pirellula sp.]